MNPLLATALYFGWLYLTLAWLDVPRLLLWAQPALWRARAAMDGSDPTATTPSSYQWTPGAEMSLRVFLAVLPLLIGWLWPRKLK